MLMLFVGCRQMNDTIEHTHIERERKGENTGREIEKATKTDTDTACADVRVRARKTAEDNGEKSTRKKPYQQK